MPVKIRCTGCQKSLNVPDAARGKVVKCPACETKLKVPAGSDGEEAIAAAPRKAAAGKSAARKAPKRPQTEEDFLSGLDLGRVEDTSVRVCPKCGTETDLEEPVCPKCGIEFATGQLSAAAARRKGMRGPDPREFYGAAWKDSWQFLMKNKNLAFRTGMYWTLFGVLSTNAMLLSAWCATIPPKMFWLALSFLFSAGSTGWYWFLNKRIIEFTMNREKKIKKETVRFDLLLNAGLGIKALIWPWGLTFPLILAPAMLSGAYMYQASEAVAQAKATHEAEEKEKKVAVKDRQPLSREQLQRAVASVSPGPMAMAWIASIPVVMLISLTFPVAQVHLTAPYPWTAWSFWNMVAASFKNFLPVAYYWITAIAVFIPFVVLLVVLSVIGATSDTFSQAKLAAFFAEQVKWLLEQAGAKPDDPGLVGYLILASAIVLITAVSLAPSSFLMAFPSVFMMRVNGLFGYYNRETLDLETTTQPNVPAGFWPRWVAGISDFVILCGIAFVLSLIGNLFDLVLSRMGVEIVFTYFGIKMGGFSGAALLGTAVITMLYFVNSESGPGQGTPGMRSVGMIVTDLEGKRITKQKAFGRFFGRFVSILPAGIGLFMAAFTEKKQTLHDSMSKTLVVWKGDDEATQRQV